MPLPPREPGTVQVEPVHPAGEADAPEESDDRASTERLVFFTDAVLAIALTLLAIDLPVPEQGSSREMLHAAAESWPTYLAFLISFVVIGAHWRLHHQVFAHVHRAPRLLVRLNQGWLLLAVVTPFLTRLLSEGRLNVVRFAPYAAAQTLQFALMATMVEVIRRQRLAGDAGSGGLRVTATRSAVFAATFAVSIPVYLVLGSWAFVVWVAVPQGNRLLRRLRRLRALRATPAGRPPQH